MTGGSDYQINIERIAYIYKGGAPIEWLENQTVERVETLSKNTNELREEVGSGQ